jgi:hypothetical protein
MKCMDIKGNECCGQALHFRTYAIAARGKILQVTLFVYAAMKMNSCGMFNCSLRYQRSASLYIEVRSHGQLLKHVWSVGPDEYSVRILYLHLSKDKLEQQ